MVSHLSMVCCFFRSNSNRPPDSGAKKAPNSKNNSQFFKFFPFIQNQEHFLQEKNNQAKFNRKSNRKPKEKSAQAGIRAVF